MRYAAVFAVILILSSCSDTPKPEEKTEVKKAPAMPTGAIAAFTAYYPMYKVARQWAPDMQVASLTGSDAEGVTSEAGKYPIWTAVFVSSAKQQSQTYSYSTVEQGRTMKGLNNGGVMRWGGPTRDAEPFPNSDLSINSDAAYKTAADKAAEWLKKNPTKAVTTFALGHASRLPAPMWYIQWGTKTGGYAVYVNATTGTVFGK